MKRKIRNLILSHIYILLFLLASPYAKSQDSKVKSEDLAEVLQHGSDQKSETTGLDEIKKSILSILTKNKTNSLMFDPEEEEKINRAVESLKNNETYIPEDFIQEEQSEEDIAAQEEEEAEKRAKENEKSYIYLSSILYLSPKEWVVWLNNEKITSQSNNIENEFYLKNVQRDKIKAVWKLSISKWKILSGKSSEDESSIKTNSNNQVEIQFDLRPNQTYVLKTDKIVEGRGIIDQIRKKEEEKIQKAKSLISGQF